MSYLALAKKIQAEIQPSQAAAVEPGVVDDILNEPVIALLIESTILGAPLWFAFSPAFDPGDGVPVFYADEIESFKNKSAETLRKIYETKRAFGLRTRVRQ